MFSRRAERMTIFSQLFGVIIIQPFANRKTSEQRRGQQSAARRRADQGEARQIQPHTARVRALVDDDVQFEILHRGIEIFLDGLLQAMDFIDEQHVAFFEIGQQAGEVAGFFDGRAAGAFQVGAHGFGDDVGEGGFAQAGRAAEQDVIDGFAALFGGGDGDFEPFLDLGLAGEIGKKRRAQRHFQRGVGLGQDI